MAQYRILTASLLACCVGLGLVQGLAQAQSPFVYNQATTGTNWQRNNAWTVDGASTGTNYPGSDPNRIGDSAVFNLPLDSANYTVGFNRGGTPPVALSVNIGSLYINHVPGHNFSTVFSGTATRGNIFFQGVGGVPAVYHEIADFDPTTTGTGATTFNATITLLSDLRVTLDHFIKASPGGTTYANGATVFADQINAAADFTFYKAGKSNLNVSLTNASRLGVGDGFFGSYVIEEGAMRFLSNLLLKDAKSFTVEAGGQLQIGGSAINVGDVNLGVDALGDPATLKLNGTGVIGGPTANGGALRFQLDNDVTTNFNSPIELQSAATITIQNAAANAVANLTKAVSGAGGLTKDGNGALHLTGTDSNTHAGGTGVASGKLLLNKSGGAIAVPGQLNIGGTSFVVLEQNHQIADNALLRFTSTTAEGTLQLGADRQETVGGLLSTNPPEEPTSGIIEANSVQTSTSTLEINAVHQSLFGGMIRDSIDTEVLPGKLAIVKSGPESLELTGNQNTYSGGTTVSGGALLVNNVSGSGVGTGDVTVDNGGILGGRGFVGDFSTPVAVNVAGGVINPGDAAPGALTMHGNITLDAASSITFDLAGASAGFEYDQLIVHNDLDLGGATLNFSLGDFVPTGVESFTLISKESDGAIAGTFGNYGEGAAVNLAGVSYLLSYAGGSGNDVVLTLDPNPPTFNADFNDDGVVDGNDFLVWQRGFGGPGGLAQGDANDDNVVNGADLQVWKDQFGTPGPGVGATAAAIPEPASAALLASAIGGLLIAARRRGAT